MRLPFGEQEKVVIRAVGALSANRSVSMWPSVKILARQVQLATRIVNFVLGKLEEQGVVELVSVSMVSRVEVRCHLTARGLRLWSRFQREDDRMSKKVCSRCGLKHSGKYATCNNCRAYNNANKMIYRLAEEWEMDPEEVREGIKQAVLGEKQ